MSNKIFVLGTYDQRPESLFDVDLMRYLSDAGVPPIGIVYKGSRPTEHPPAPVSNEFGDGRLCVRVRDFNAAETVSVLAALDPDLLVYAGGRDILRPSLLRVAKHGCIGGHYGHLPVIRGMATVEWSVLLGVAPTVAIQRISPGIDTGEILMQARLPLVANDTYTSIRDRSYFLTKVMLAFAARGLLAGNWKGTPQISEAGQQYYRLHPAVQVAAERALSRVLGTRDGVLSAPVVLG